MAVAENHAAESSVTNLESSHVSAKLPAAPMRLQQYARRQAACAERVPLRGGVGPEGPVVHALGPTRPIPRLAKARASLIVVKALSVYTVQKVPSNALPISRRHKGST